MVSSLENDYIFLFDPEEVTLTSTSTPGQTGPEIYGNEGILHIAKSFRSGVSPSNIV